MDYIKDALCACVCVCVCVCVGQGGEYSAWKTSVWLVVMGNGRGCLPKGQAPVSWQQESENCQGLQTKEKKDQHFLCHNLLTKSRICISFFSISSFRFHFTVKIMSVSISYYKL